MKTNQNIIDAEYELMKNEHGKNYANMVIVVLGYRCWIENTISSGVEIKDEIENLNEQYLALLTVSTIAIDAKPLKLTGDVDRIFEKLMINAMQNEVGG
jgi:hypothetical protein